MKHILCLILCLFLVDNTVVAQNYARVDTLYQGTLGSLIFQSERDRMSNLMPSSTNSLIFRFVNGKKELLWISEKGLVDYRSISVKDSSCSIVVKKSSDGIYLYNFKQIKSNWRLVDEFYLCEYYWTPYRKPLKYGQLVTPEHYELHYFRTPPYLSEDGKGYVSTPDSTRVFLINEGQVESYLKK